MATAEEMEAEVADGSTVERGEAIRGALRLGKLSANSDVSVGV